MANPQPDGGRAGEETAGKVEDADSWEVSPSGPTKGGAPPTLVETPPSPAASASQGGVALKVGGPGVLQPYCLGEGPLMLPIHLQMAGGAGAPLGPMGASPCFLTGGGALSLPLVLDQQLLQHLGSGLLPQGLLPQGLLPQGLPLQSNMLIQNASLSFGPPPPPPLDQKPSGGGHFQDANVLALLQNPAFAALLQDLFSSQTGSSSFQAGPGPAPADSFANATFFAPPPPGSHPYSSPLAPLVPPATLLVPYPVVIPLPVPLPIPLPIPVPVPPAEDSKGSVPRAVCTVSRGTQTAAAAAPPSPSLPAAAAAGPPPLAPSSPPPADGEALDLSVRTCPLQPKLEPPCLQDDVLDLSVPRAAVPLSCVAHRATHDSGTAALALGVLRPVECSGGVGSTLLRGLTASLEFSRKHKWLVEGGAGGAGAAGKLELVGTSQTAKVIVSVKDAIPAILCGKLKGLSGVSTKNFSIKRDGAQAAGGGAALQQLCGGAAARGQGDPPDSGNAHRKLAKSRAVKLKKVSAQEIHLVPIKKQRLAAYLPRK
ncbi:retinoic acid-induced protein 2 [Gadus morhua]|uniref:Retinoic acid induced 2 n=1 Tax=Gadus morhua TaxID=8049 RepID=A0A8C5FB11_GADMO|nr:retinoic acid-induced protein 2 [Gadus morhua]